MKKKIADLPRSDSKYWDGAETHKSSPKNIPLCQSHTKNWEQHSGYIDNHDSTVTCKYCPWGTMLPGYTRVVDGKIVNLKRL